ncbi:translation factor [Annulohypoxylon maeteangense]|uniref:translation factor n=1 Tax=Annulohypoxylon maeteangense TaxID=1927788 RepID=UPI002008C2BB|nr:translation factor [Annulohypoxylon maeteangense]KAI0889691.1 translation factor [Annulohypoxylon maeteangense]
MHTRVLKIPERDLGKFKENEGYEKLKSWEVSQTQSSSLEILHEAAEYLRTKDTPVAFPTETVYGLGADATRSCAVRGIYTAKRRPADNPLIIHISDLDMLRNVLVPVNTTNGTTNGTANGTIKGTTDTVHDRIPEIYKPLIERFWPGPLTILLPNPTPSKLAPEVTAGLKTFGVRMPKSPLALSLIKLTGAPLAAPSANASTKPSPTTAEHVLEDLDGRIELILDGGSCHVGVESTVVDGLCDPPLILRPGGVSIDELRSCAGWEKIEKGYKDQSELGKAAPRAPGMKYKHYSPKAKVVLYEATFAAAKDGVQAEDFEAFVQDRQSQQDLRVGIIRTRYWKPAAGLRCGDFEKRETVKTETTQESQDTSELDVQETALYDTTSGASIGKLMDISIGADTRSIAQGLFSALRELDRRGADIIFVEGTVDDEDIGAAVMNRLRKAATRIRS